MLFRNLDNDMASLVLFETTESVIEILWDIALAFFIVRLSLIYFFLAFSTGTLASYVLYTRLLPINHLTTPQTEVAVVPFLFALTIVWARLIVWHYEIPRVRGFRLAIGGLAALFMVFAEMVVALVAYEEGIGDWIWETDLRAGIAFALLLTAFALMPTMLMALERRPEELEQLSHGHGQKSVVNAV
jgi:hypothetical protein